MLIGAKFEEGHNDGIKCFVDISRTRFLVENGRITFYALK
jgi:hypothetical protein